MGIGGFIRSRSSKAVQGEPRAMGTLTTLESGRIIAPFAELNDRILQQPPPAAVFRGPRRNLGRQ